MKNDGVSLYAGLVILLIISCQPQQKTTADLTAAQTYSVDSVNDLPKSWTMLTEYNGKQVIYHPCDANNTVVEIRHDTLYINWGQEEGFYNIISITKNAPNKITFLAKGDLEETPDTFHLEFLDNAKKKARLFVWLNDSTSQVFTDTRLVRDYEDIKQPCRECWGRDVCDEAEKSDSIDSQ